MQFSTKGAIGIIVATVCGCNPPPGVDEKEPLEAGDEGITSPNVDLPSGETGEELDPVALPTGECIQYLEPPLYAYVHQCEGRAKLSYQAKNESGSYSFTFGPGAKNPSLWVRPDSYALPLVAACCGRFNYENPTFEQKLPYLNNCLIDTVQQTCHGSRTCCAGPRSRPIRH